MHVYFRSVDVTEICLTIHDVLVESCAAVVETVEKSV